MEDDSEQPAEGARGRRSRRYALVGAVIGAVLVLVCFAVAALAGGTHWSFVVILATLGGAAVGGSFAPLFSLARDDGDDADAFRGDGSGSGQADTSTDGAQAQDRASRMGSDGNQDG
jgi:hypothetical protein